MSEGAGVLILLISAAITIACYKLARAFGADFGVTAKAVLFSLVVLAAAFAAMAKRWLGVCLSTLGAFVLIWPAWWPVITSSYEGGAAPGALARLPWNEVPTWVGIAEYGVEALMLALTFWCWRKSSRY